jgi:hypothetical protein
MLAVAKRLLSSLLAAAKISLAALFRLELQGLKGRILVLAIAKRLVLASPAAAPEVGLAFLELDNVWLFLRDHRFTHYHTHFLNIRDP